MSGFWGGAICLHMSKAQPFLVQSAFLIITWVGGYLRVPGTFGSFTVRGESELGKRADADGGPGRLIINQAAA